MVWRKSPVKFSLIIFDCIILVKAFTSLTSGSSFGKYREAGLAVLFLLRVESSALEPAWVLFYSPVRIAPFSTRTVVFRRKGRHGARLPLTNPDSLAESQTRPSCLYTTSVPESLEEPWAPLTLLQASRPVSTNF